MSASDHAVVWPRAEKEAVLRPLAPRLDSLEGKTVAQLWDYLFRGDEIFPMLEEALSERYPGIRFVSYDTFGFEGSFRRGSGYVQLPTDTQRIHEIRDLFDRGHADRIVVSHDLCYRMMTRAWGGWGLGHLLTTLPERFEAVGLGVAERDRLLVATPARLLTLP